MAHVLDLTHIMLWVIEKQTKMYKQISGYNMVLVNLIYSSFFLNKYIVHTLELQIFKLQKKTTNIWVYEMPLSYPKRCDFFIDKTVFSFFFWKKDSIFLVPVNQKGALISECIGKNSIFDVYTVICMSYTPTLSGI